MVSNKEVIDKLRNYFERQDTKVVSHLCATFIIDINRFMNINDLSEMDKADLRYRSRQNLSQIENYIKSGFETELKLTIRDINE